MIAFAIVAAGLIVTFLAVWHEDPDRSPALAAVLTSLSALVFAVVLWTAHVQRG